MQKKYKYNLVKKVTVCFTIISNIAVTTRIPISNIKAGLFMKDGFITTTNSVYMVIGK